MAILATEPASRPKGYTVVTATKGGTTTETISAEEGDRQVAEARAGQTTVGQIAVESAKAVAEDVSGTAAKIVDTGLDFGKILLFAGGLYLVSQLLPRRAS